MMGDDTRFLTGTDEHSVNIAQAAEAAASRRARSWTRVALFKRPRTRSRSARTASSAPPIPTTPAPPEMVRRAYANGDIYKGTYDGWYCPGEGSSATDRSRRRRVSAPTTPPWRCSGSEQNWFFRLSAYQDRARAARENPDFVEPEYRRNEVLGFIRQGLQDFSISRAGATWGIPFPDPTAVRPAPGRLLGPRRRHDLRLVRRADQLHHRRRFPGRPGAVPASGGRPTST